MHLFRRLFTAFFLAKLDKKRNCCLFERDLLKQTKLVMILFDCLPSGAFSDEDIVHVEGDVDPSRDLEIIHNELRLKDLETIGKNYEKLEREVQRGGQSADKKKKEAFVSSLLFILVLYSIYFYF